MNRKKEERGLRYGGLTEMRERLAARERRETEDIVY